MPVSTHQTTHSHKSKMTSKVLRRLEWQSEYTTMAAQERDGHQSYVSHVHVSIVFTAFD